MIRLAVRYPVAITVLLVTVWTAGCLGAEFPSTELAGHWPLAGDARDHSPGGRDAIVKGALDFKAAGPADRPNTAAAFKGRDTWLEVPLGGEKPLGHGDFSLSLWAYSDDKLDDVPGDLVSQYDAAVRRGFQLTLKTNAGVTTSQANLRQLQFGIDNGRQSDWADCGRPGQAILAFALATYDGQLYAGTCEPGADQSGRVYRYAGGAEWTDCGAPATCNSVTALAECAGQLYAGVGKYRLGGSALTESTNTNLGGRVLRYDGGTRWVDCGQLPGVEAIGGLVEFRGALYATSLYRPAGFFRYDGGTQWTDCGTPGVRVEALAVYNGHLYASSYDGGRVFRFDGKKWTDCGQLGAAADNTQTYSFAVYRGRLYVGTWRSGRVYRFEDVGRWTDVGRLGEELEVMGMLVHNGRLIAGTLPLAEVYEYDGAESWRRLTRLDHTPDVTYRRAWTMAEARGRVFCSTLPSGRIYSTSVGTSAMADRSLTAGWHHLSAVKASERLRLFVDGQQIAESEAFDPADYDLTSAAPLRIGKGENDVWHGRIADVRWYRRALGSGEIRELAERRP